MLLKSLHLTHIRSHQGFELPDASQATLIVGKNGSGKSTILESVHLLSTGSSDRAEKIAELIQFDQEVGRIRAEVVDGSETDRPIGWRTPHAISTLECQRGSAHASKGKRVHPERAF